MGPLFHLQVQTVGTCKGGAPCVSQEFDVVRCGHAKLACNHARLARVCFFCTLQLVYTSDNCD